MLRISSVRPSVRASAIISGGRRPPSPASTTPPPSSLFFAVPEQRRGRRPHANQTQNPHSTAQERGRNCGKRKREGRKRKRFERQGSRLVFLLPLAGPTERLSVCADCLETLRRGSSKDKGKREGLLSHSFFLSSAAECDTGARARPPPQPQPLCVSAVACCSGRGLSSASLSLSSFPGRDLEEEEEEIRAWTPRGRRSRIQCWCIRGAAPLERGRRRGRRRMIGGGGDRGKRRRGRTPQ